MHSKWLNSLPHPVEIVAAYQLKKEETAALLDVMYVGATGDWVKVDGEEFFYCSIKDLQNALYNRNAQSLSAIMSTLRGVGIIKEHREFHNRRLIRIDVDAIRKKIAETVAG